MFGNIKNIYNTVNSENITLLIQTYVVVCLLQIDMYIFLPFSNLIIQHDFWK